MCGTPACATCERLRMAALEIVCESGAASVCEDGLARRAGISWREVAHHYATPADCLYATYDEAVSDVTSELADAFEDESDWQSGLEFSRRRMLEWMTANPAQARLFFVETVRADRELRHRRDQTRERIVEYLKREHARREAEEVLPTIQFEMLVGAAFQTVSSAVAEGDPADLTELEPRLSELAGCFVPMRA